MVQMTVSREEQNKAFLGTVEFERATRKHYEAILDLCVNEFVKAEPHCRALRLAPPSCTPLFAYLVNKSLDCPESIIAREKASGEIVGFRLMSVGHRDPQPDEHSEDLVLTDKNSLILVEMLDVVKQMIFDRLPDVHTMLRREVSFLIPRVQGKGLGSKMVEEGLDYDELRKEGIQGIVSEAVSLTNQRLLRKKGFQLVGELDKSFHAKHNIVLDDGTQTMEALFKDIRKEM